MVSITPLRTALERAYRIQGMFLGDLAREYQAQGHSLTGGKGWIGNLVEHVVAGTKDERQAAAQDLTQAGVEIKAFGVGKGGDPTEAWEDLRLRTVDFEELATGPWYESELLVKLRATVMVPYWRPPLHTLQSCRRRGDPDSEPSCRDPRSSCMQGGECECRRFCPCRGSGSDKSKDLAEWSIMSPFVWIPSARALEIFQADWDRHADLVKEGGDDPLGGLPANFGKMLRAATHGTTAAENWQVYKDTQGREWDTKGRSWYLRKAFVSQVCKENIPGPWRGTGSLDYLA